MLYEGAGQSHAESCNSGVGQGLAPAEKGFVVERFLDENTDICQADLLRNPFPRYSGKRRPLPYILNAGGLLTIWEEGRSLPPEHQAERRA